MRYFFLIHLIVEKMELSDKNNQYFVIYSISLTNINKLNSMREISDVDDVIITNSFSSCNAIYDMISFTIQATLSIFWNH